jgi:hypothetical protein
MCVSCGLEVKTGKSFCGNCGAPQAENIRVSTSELDDDKSPVGKSKAGAIVGAIAAGLVVGAIFVGVVFWAPWQNLAQMPTVSPYPSWIPSVIPTLLPTALPLDDGSGDGLVEGSTDYYETVIPKKCPLSKFRAANPNDGNPLSMKQVQTADKLSCWFWFPNSDVGWSVEYKLVTETQWQKDLSIRQSEGYVRLSNGFMADSYALSQYSQVAGDYYNSYLIHDGYVEVWTDVYEEGLSIVYESVMVN